MSRVNDVHAGIWAEEEFLDLTAGAKLLYLWSFTNPLCGMSGVYRVARRAIAFELGVTVEQVQKALDELQAQRFVVYADGVMFVRTRVKHLRSKTEQIAKSIAADVRRLPADHAVRQAFMDEYGTDAEWGEGRLVAQLHSASKEPLQEPQRTSANLNEVPGLRQGQGQENNQEDGRASDDAPAKPAARRKPSPPPPDELPDDLPQRLHPVADAVHAVLCRVADAKGAKPVTRAAVGRVLATNPNHDHVRVAGEFEHWWVHGDGATRRVRDVVATFRTRLSSLPEQPAAALGGAARHLQAVTPGVSPHAAEIAERVARTRAILAAEEADRENA